MLRKKICWISCLIICCSHFAAAQSVDELIQKNIEARGGSDRLKAVETFQLYGKQVRDNVEYVGTMKKKRPNLIRIDSHIQGQQIVQAFDGKTAWEIDPSDEIYTPQPMQNIDGLLVKLEADIDGHLFGYKGKGHTSEYMGKENLEGTDVHKIKLTLKSCVVLYFYLDAEYFIELKMTAVIPQPENEIMIDFYYSDFKEVNGIMYAHASEARIGNYTIYQMAIDKIEINIPIDDAIFMIPEG